MRYHVITSENFSSIEKIRENAKNDIIRRSQVDSFDNYTHGEFAILGDAAIKMFCEKYGYNITARRETIKTDGKTTAKIIPFITASYYYDARDGRGGITDVNNYTTINYLISFDGVLFTVPVFCTGKTVGLYLFNDDTDYNTYLRYYGRENEKPNNIGILTDKKLKAWEDWLLLRKKTAEDNKESANNNVVAFLAKVRALDTTGCKEVRIGNDSGIIVKNGLLYSYSISRGGYISEKIEIAYTNSNLSTLEKFEKMAKGEF